MFIHVYFLYIVVYVILKVKDRKYQNTIHIYNVQILLYLLEFRFIKQKEYF